MKKVLIISGINLYQNSSVCLANSAYIKGFLQNDYDVTVIMPDIDSADRDKGMSLPDGARYFIYSRTSKFEQRIAKTVKTDAFTEGKKSVISYAKDRVRWFLSATKQRLIKKSSIGTDSFYANYKIFFREVIKHSRDYCDRGYDLLLTMSSPIASHVLGDKIIKETDLHYKTWCQLWQDPWYYDLYIEKDSAIFEEEKRLLSLADSVEYVTPITCYYQKLCFKEYAKKMNWSFLPCNEEIVYPSKDIAGRVKLGYFGEYVSTVRNMAPLAEAISESKTSELIACGNTDLDMGKYQNTTTYGRVSMVKVNQFQAECDILVNISNLKGGQIPGKVYQYAGTSKPVLFILDGTETEKKIILENFDKYNRFIFCENTKENISACLEDIKNLVKSTDNKPVNEFSPKVIVSHIIQHQNG